MNAGLAREFASEAEAKMEGFHLDWTAGEINEHLQTMFKGPLTSVQEKMLEDTVRQPDLWRPLVKKKNTDQLEMYQKEVGKLTGTDIFKIKTGGASRGWLGANLYFGQCNFSCRTGLTSSHELLQV